MKNLSVFRAGASSALLVLVCSAVGHLLYLALVVPALPGLRTVPLVWWFGLAAPVAVVIFRGGWRARTFSATFAAASTSLLAVLSYEAVATALRLRPFLKADVVDAFWSTRTLLVAVAVLGLTWGGHVARTQLERVGNAS